jgi:hypothetical protein
MNIGGALLVYRIKQALGILGWISMAAVFAIGFVAIIFRIATGT